MSDVLFKIMYIVFLLIIFSYEIIYIRLKYFKKDKRLQKVSFIKFLWNTREILNEDNDK